MLLEVKAIMINSPAKTVFLLFLLGACIIVSFLGGLNTSDSNKQSEVSSTPGIPYINYTSPKTENINTMLKVPLSNQPGSFIW